MGESTLLKTKKIFQYVFFYILPFCIAIGALVYVLYVLPNKKETAEKPSRRSILSSKTKPAPLLKDFHLNIPSLDISTPVIPDVNGADKEGYFKALEDGVAQMLGSSKPGEGSNIFIFGHSSYYANKPGNYKEIFKSLENIKVGDEINLKWQAKDYTYKVTETKIIDPKDIEVIKPTENEQVTLMTCVPPGTADKRLIVIAK